MQEITPVPVAIVGCGIVGTATAQLLLRDRTHIAARAGVDIDLRAIVSRTFTRARAAALPESLFEPDVERVLADPEIATIIELIGGIESAQEIIERAIDAGKNVVTANKALLAHRGPELFARARERGVTIAFEGSCGGGIPIIRAITDGLLVNRIDAIYGIVNGTCNFILTEMITRGLPYAEALRGAQAAGIAEAVPDLDVEGTDSAHKIAIMAALAFGVRADLRAIPVQGIDTLDRIDVTFGRRLGYVVKLIAAAVQTDDGVVAWVQPAFISTDHPLAWVGGPFNAVSVYGHVTGHTLHYGRGAGGEPTASAVVSDIVGLAMGTLPTLFQRTGYWPDLNAAGELAPIDRYEQRMYLRVTAQERPGSLAEVGAVLARNGISIASVVQDERTDGTAEGVPVVITTHRARRDAVARASTEIDALECTTAPTVTIPILDEHPEQIVL